jgi:hypothetical protein
MLICPFAMALACCARVECYARQQDSDVDEEDGEHGWLSSEYALKVGNPIVWRANTLLIKDPHIHHQPSRRWKVKRHGNQRPLFQRPGLGVARTAALADDFPDRGRI